MNGHQSLLNQPSKLQRDIDLVKESIRLERADLMRESLTPDQRMDIELNILTYQDYLADLRSRLERPI